METGKQTAVFPFASLSFPLLQLLLVLFLMRDLLWQQERIISTDQGGDVFVQFYAWRHFAVTHLLNGEFPFWNPHIFGGIPFFGGMQSALLYPLNALFLILPTAVATNWSVALHLWLMGLFTTLWLRHGLQLSRLAAGMGGIMMMFSGPFFMHIHGGQLTNLSVMVWVPLLLLSVERWFKGGDTRWLALGATTVALQIAGGHPQYLYYSGITMLLYGGWHLLARSTQRRHDALGIVAIYSVGALMGAVQLLPGWESAQESVRGGGTTLTFVAEGSLPPGMLVTLLAPHLLDLAPDKAWLWETTLYFGVLGLALSLIGLRHPQRFYARGFSLLVVILMLLALGRYTPLFPLLYHTLPGFDLFRGTTKFAFFAVLFAVALAAMGIDRLRVLSIDERSRLAPPFAVSAVSLAIALVILKVLIDKKTDNPLFEHIGALHTIIFDLGVAIAMLAIAALLLRWRGRWHGLALPLLMVALLSELYLDAATHLPSFAKDELLKHPIVEALRTHPNDERVLNLDFRNAAMLTGNYEVWGNDPGTLKRWAEFIAATQGVTTPQNQNIYFNDLVPSLAIARLGWEVRDSSGKLKIKTTETPPFPRARLFHSIEVAPPTEVLKRLVEPTFDFRHILLMEPPFSFQTSPLGQGKVTQLGSTINSLDLQVANDAPSVLLVTDAYSRGWRAFEVGGGREREYPVVPADHAFIGIPLPAGEHHIHLEYRPRTLKAGIFLSTTGLLLLLLLVWQRSPLSRKMAKL